MLLLDSEIRLCDEEEGALKRWQIFVPAGRMAVIEHLLGVLSELK